MFCVTFSIGRGSVLCHFCCFSLIFICSINRWKDNGKRQFQVYKNVCFFLKKKKKKTKKLGYRDWRQFYVQTILDFDVEQNK